LEMTFTNFLPGRSIQFMTELDSPGLDTFENYQTVFFTLNGAANNVSSNLQLWATYDNGQNLISRLGNFASTDGPPFVFKQTGQSGVSVNQTKPELQVGGSDQDVLVLDTDVGGFLPYADERAGILNASIRLDPDIVRAAQQNPNLGLLASLGLQAPSQFVSFKGLLFFTASNPEVGRELWATDGTRAGTFLVRDINPGNG